MRLSTFTLSMAFLLLISCSTWSKFDSRAAHPNKEITHKALFEYFKKPDTYCPDRAGKGPVKIDRVLRTRDSLIVFGKVYFDDPMHSDLLKKPLPVKSYRLTIPDSLANRYVLTSDTSDYELDYALIYQFSPLLPTKDPDIYLMELYMWLNCCDDERCYRILHRRYLRFKINGRDIVLLNSVFLDKQNDLIGFGGFERSKMEEALPGEKIFRHFRW